MRKREMDLKKLSWLKTVMYLLIKRYYLRRNDQWESAQRIVIHQMSPPLRFVSFCFGFLVFLCRIFAVFFSVIQDFTGRRQNSSSDNGEMSKFGDEHVKSGENKENKRNRKVIIPDKQYDMSFDNSLDVENFDVGDDFNSSLFRENQMEDDGSLQNGQVISSSPRSFSIAEEKSYSEERIYGKVCLCFFSI